MSMDSVWQIFQKHLQAFHEISATFGEAFEYRVCFEVASVHFEVNNSITACLEGNVACYQCSHCDRLRN